MSYCRWSSDDYKCDVYTYEDTSGQWVTHVAGRRHVPLEPLPAQVDLPTPFTDEQWAAWCERHQAVMRIIGDADLVEIGLPHDGKRFADDTPRECAETLLALREVGYNVPQYAIDELLDEAGGAS